LSARGRGGRVQRIGGAVRSRGSGHGGDGGCAGELLGSWVVGRGSRVSVGGSGIVLVGEGAICGKRATSSAVRAHRALNAAEDAGTAGKRAAGERPDGGEAGV
jgi:hypothetical protein